MGDPLRQRRTAAEWAAVTQAIDFDVKIGDLAQLAAVVEADLGALAADKVPAKWRESAITGRLEFGFADAQQQLPSVSCRVAGTVDLVCQRCLEAFRLPLEVEAELLLLEFDQEAPGFEQYEVWELEEPLLRPLDIVEELLIMALPLSAMHVESSSCRALTAGKQKGAEEKTTPFAALREQMAQDKDSSA